MIVIGTDTHKSTHTCAVAKSGTGELQGELAARAREHGFRELLGWSRSLDEERIWALEDCRHVPGSLERFLVESGERVVRVPPKLMGASRRGERARGKSDPIDALAIARAALREGPESLPAAHLDEGALELKLLCDHREDFVRARGEDQQRLRWHLHDLWPELGPPAGCLDRIVWLDRIARRLARAEQTARVRIARDLVRAVRERTRRVKELEREIGALARAEAPQLLELPGCGALTVAKLVAETAGVKRFASDAKLARLAGVAPIPASSGRRDRHRLDRGGNRQLNCALHRIAVTQGAPTRRRASSWPESRPRASRAWRRFAASSATSPEPSGRRFAPPATESRSTPSPLLMKFPNCGQSRVRP
jgi:transposase